MTYEGHFGGRFRLRLEVFQATGSLRKITLDGTVNQRDGGEEEINNGERVVLFWILIPGIVIISTTAVALVGICYR